MPIPLRSLKGLVPLAAEQQLRDLTLAVNALEGGVGGAARESALAERVASLEAEVHRLTNLVGTTTAAPAANGTDFGPGPVASITIVNGVVTACS